MHLNNKINLYFSNKKYTIIEAGITEKGKPNHKNLLTHWDRMTHIYVGNLTIIGSDTRLSPGRRQAII